MNLKANFDKLKKATTIKELINILDSSFLINVAFVILTAITLTPFIALFTGYNLFMTNYILFFGFLGCIVTFVSFLKSRFSFGLSNKEYFKCNIIPIFLFIMLLWAIPSTFLATDFDTALYGSPYRQSGLLMHIAYCGYFGCGYIVSKGNKLSYIFNLFSIISVILTIFMIIDSPVLNMYFKTTQTCSVFFNQNHTGYYFCIATILSTVEILRLKLETERAKLIFLLQLIILGLCFYGNILSCSTGSFLAIIFGGCCLIFATSLFNKQILKHAIFIFVTLIAVIIISVFTAKNPLIDSLQILFDINSILNNPKSPDALLAGNSRWNFWLETVEFIKEKPLLGYGLDCLGPEFSKVGIDYDKPHCEPLQFAAELGIPAAIAYLITVITFVVTFFKKKISSPLVIGLVCTVGAYICSSLFGNTMFYTSPFFFMIYGMATSRIKNNPS